MFSLLKQIFVILALLSTVGLGYYLYTQNFGALEDTTNAGGSAGVAVEAASFLRRLNELKAIQIDKDVFSDPRFSYLIDVDSTVQPEPVGGRSNPFKDVQ